MNWVGVVAMTVTPSYKAILLLSYPPAWMMISIIASILDTLRYVILQSLHIFERIHDLTEDIMISLCCMIVKRIEGIIDVWNFACSGENDIG